MRSRTILLCLGALAVWLLAPPTLAEEVPPDPDEVGMPDDELDAAMQAEGEAVDEAEAEEPVALPTAYAREGAPTLHGKLALSLEDAIKMGLENNLDVQVERYAPLIADYDESIAWGAYDPTFFAEFGYFDETRENTSLLSGNPSVETEVLDGVGGLRGVLPLLSTEYEGRYQGGRSEVNQTFQSLSPQFDSGWSVSVTQPLLRDLIWNQPWTQVKTSRLLLESSEESFRASVMDTVRAIEDAYWTLIAQDEARRVAQKSLETAKALLDQTETQYEVGVVSKVEVTEAQAGLSQREVSLIRAENQYRNQQDVLINLVLGPGLRSGSTMEIVATDKPQEYVPYTIDVPTAVERAFENRPELVAAQREIERQNLQLKFAKNQRLPSLDGVFSYGQTGLSGDQNPALGDPCASPFPPPSCPAPPQIAQGPWDNTLDDYSDNPVWSARGVFSIPIPNTSARSQVSRTELELRRATSVKRRLEQQIILDVRQSARNLEAAQQGIDAARDAQTAAEEQLRAERIRLEYGESTPFDVLQREEDLVDRENQLIGAFQAYRTSVTALDRAQGTILRNRNIRIDEVGALR